MPISDLQLCMSMNILHCTYLNPVGRLIWIEFCMERASFHKYLHLPADYTSLDFEFEIKNFKIEHVLGVLAYTIYMHNTYIYFSETLEKLGLMLAWKTEMM